MSSERQPGALRGQFWISPDFDDFTEQDELDWYGDDEEVSPPSD